MRLGIIICGMNTGFLSHLRPVLERAVEAGEYPGVQELVLDHGRVVFHAAIGMADVERGVPVARDTIYRMFSSSKTVTGVAAAMCVERGLFSLLDPVGEYLPGFKDAVVGPNREPVQRPVRVIDILSMTSGLDYSFDWSKEKKPLSTVEFANRLGREPLLFQPGDHWNYGYSADVAGALVEVVSGKSFGQFLKDELFDPLGMKDTGFVVPPAKRHRLAQAYEGGPDGRGNFVNKLAPHHLGLRDYKEDTVFESGGAGLVSTVDDWAQFTRMLMAGGTLAGHRYLSPAGFKLIHTSLLTPEQARTFVWDDCTGHGYGFFYHVKRAGVSHSDMTSPGTFAWGGWLGTMSFVDPVLNCGSVFLVQKTSSASLSSRVRNIVCAAASIQ